MQAENPEDICRLFQSCMGRGDIDAVLDLYDAEVAFVNEAGAVKTGLEALRAELAPVAATTPRFDFEVKLIARSADVALMHTWWTVSSSEREPRSVHAIEVARRRPDGTWRWLIGDPFTVGRLSRTRAS